MAASRHFVVAALLTSWCLQGAVRVGTRMHQSGVYLDEMGLQMSIYLGLDLNLCGNKQLHTLYQSDLLLCRSSMDSTTLQTPGVLHRGCGQGLYVEMEA